MLTLLRNPAFADEVPELTEELRSTPIEEFLGDHLRPDEIGRLLDIYVYSFGSVATRVAFYETIAKSFSALNSIIGIEVRPYIVQFDKSTETTNAFVAKKIPD